MLSFVVSLFLATRTLFLLQPPYVFSHTLQNRLTHLNKSTQATWDVDLFFECGQLSYL